MQSNCSLGFWKARQRWSIARLAGMMSLPWYEAVDEIYDRGNARLRLHARESVGRQLGSGASLTDQAVQPYDIARSSHTSSRTFWDGSMPSESETPLQITFAALRSPESRPSGRRRGFHRLSPRPTASPAVASGPQGRAAVRGCYAAALDAGCTASAWPPASTAALAGAPTRRISTRRAVQPVRGCFTTEPQSTRSTMSRTSGIAQASSEAPI